MRRLMQSSFAALIIVFVSGMLLQNGFQLSAAAAQPEQPPLLVSAGPWLSESYPDLWWWNGETAQVFEGCANDVIESEVVLSSSQPVVAYLSTADIWVDLLQTGEGASGGDFPNEVLLCNLETGEITDVTHQPENATVEAGQPSYYVSRSLPSWSPDGTQLAWSEYTVGADTVQLIMYDLTTAETSVLVEDLNPQQVYDMVMRREVFWSQAGIGVENFAPGHDNFEIYSPAGELLNSFPLPPNTHFQFWITYQAALYASYYDRDTGDWHLVDPLTGDDQPMPGLPEIYSLAAPDGLALRYEVDVEPSLPQPLWSVVDGDSVTPLDFDGGLSFDDRIALSPDGQSITYVYEDRLWQWQAGESAIAPGMEDLMLDTPYVSLVWTPTAWRVGADE